MASPLSNQAFLAALKAEGCRVVEEPGWRTHTRTSPGRPWGPVNGVMIHHTVTGPKVNAVPICRNGYADLPGPLSHTVIRRDGTIHLVGSGRTNHAGGGDPNVLAAVIDERYTTRPPLPHTHDGSANAVDGNRHFYGAECENLGDGKDPWTEAQVEAMVRFSAAITRAHGWSEKSVIGHREWSDWKSDPASSPVKGSVSVAMPDLRRRVQERLNHPASWSRTSPTPKPTTPTTSTGGTPRMNLLSLARPENLTLVQDVETPIYWTTEYIDEGNTHGTNGKTVLTNGRYTGVINVSFDLLNEGEGVEIYAIEEDSNGNKIGSAYPSVVPGVAGPGSVLPQVSIPVAGRVGQRLAFAVKSRQETPVTLTQAWLTLYTEPNA